MIKQFKLSNNAVLTVSPESRSIRSDDPKGEFVADLALTMLQTGGLIGPQVDEMTGIRGDWADPAAPFHAIRDAARTLGMTVKPV